MAAQRILGVDPGLGATGWGVIESEGRDCRHVAHGAVRTRPDWPLAVRLAAIRDAVREVSLLHGATTGAIELAFVGTNARSALALGQARAAALIGMHEAGLGISEYTPAVVKQTVTGYGQGAKGQVALMVRLQLNLDREPGPADAADALAIALTHWARARLGLA